MNADIMLLQPRLVARRRVEFCLSLNSTRAPSEPKSKSNRFAISDRPSVPAFYTLVGYTIYASGAISLSCFLNITIHKNCPFS
jgi:hypothetical protein